MDRCWCCQSQKQVVRQRVKAVPISTVADHEESQIVHESRFESSTLYSTDQSTEAYSTVPPPDPTAEELCGRLRSVNNAWVERLPSSSQSLAGDLGADPEADSFRTITDGFVTVLPRSWSFQTRIPGQDGSNAGFVSSVDYRSPEPPPESCGRCRQETAEFCGGTCGVSCGTPESRRRAAHGISPVFELPDPSAGPIYRTPPGRWTGSYTSGRCSSFMTALSGRPSFQTVVPEAGTFQTLISEIGSFSTLPRNGSCPEIESFSTLTPPDWGRVPPSRAKSVPACSSFITRVASIDTTTVGSSAPMMARSPAASSHLSDTPRMRHPLDGVAEEGLAPRRSQIRAVALPTMDDPLVASPTMDDLLASAREMTAEHMATPGASGAGGASGVNGAKAPALAPDPAGSIHSAHGVFGTTRLEPWRVRTSC